MCGGDDSTILGGSGMESSWGLASKQATEEQEEDIKAIFTVEKEGTLSCAFWSIWLLCGE